MDKDRLTRGTMDRTTFAAGMTARSKSYCPNWLLVALFLLFGALPTEAQQLVDDFNRPANTVVGGGWSETETTVGTGAQVNAAGQLVLSSAVAGRDVAWRNVGALYSSTYSTNGCTMVWAFAMRQSRADPSGFDGSNYGSFFMLGGSSSDVTIGQGYAVVVGQSGATDPLRLVRYNNGLDLNGNLTTIISATPAPFSDIGTNYLAVRVELDPLTNTWSLFAQDLTAATFSTTNPSIGGTLCGSAVDATYTGLNLPFIACGWNHATSGTDAALFDNIYVPSPSCLPVVTMAAATASALESAGTATITLNFNPATSAAGTVTIGVTNGPGAIYTTDYTTTPVTTAGAITRTVPAGATTATFTVNIVDDILTEGNETVTFTITGASAGIALGSALTTTFTIIDNDVTPTINFSTLNITVLENAGTQTFNFSINPAASAAGSFTLSVTNGPGVCYGGSPCDYTSSPFGGGGIITVNFLAGATTASFNATVTNDLNPEPTEQVTFTLTGVPVGFAIGTDNNRSLTIGDNDSPPTVLDPGDLIIVGINANNQACSGVTAQDEVSFFCFKDITFGTTIDLTDCGYSYATTGLWGDNEGVVRATRTGIAIPAGQVITFRFSGTGVGSSIAPDAAWSFVSQNGGNPLNLINSGDQLFFMQGGNWVNPGGTHDATYTGNVLYGFSTNGQWLPLQNSTNHSGLPPPRMECFSMAPTGSSNYNKYTGPTTITSQRNWILNVDDPANWTSYATCTDYNITGPNWLTAPIMPFTIVPVIPGLWRGSATLPAGTDWFNCKNWDDVQVPTITTDVIIDPALGSSRNCVVGLVAGSAAECASLTQTSGGTVRQLTVQQNSTLTIDGSLTINRTVAGGALTTTVLDNSELNCTTLTITGTTVGATNEATFRCDAGGTVRVEDDLTIGLGGLLDLQGALGSSGTLFLGGDWLNLEDELHFQDLNSRVIFNGNVDQTISTAAGAEVFSALQLAKSGGDLLLNNPVEVRTELDLGSGRVFTTAANLLTLRAGSAAINFTDLSFVHGPMQKIGNTAFTFPVGKGPNLRPCGLSTISGTASGAFQAEYFPVSAYTFGIAMEPTLHHISDCEHWIIDRTAGSGNAVVELTWDTPESCGVTSLPDMRVARWDATLNLWQDRGGNAVGTVLTGTVSTPVQQTLFSPWTLASTNGQNPLPITLIDFTAKPEGMNVRLDWSTASERNNDFFTVERSADGVLFDPILTVPGAGYSDLSLSYTDLDRAPLMGVSYYRLRQTDYDDTSTLSPIVSVVMGRNTVRPLSLFVAQGQLNALHGFPTGSRYELLDMTGRLISAGTVHSEGSLSIPLPALQSGAYLLRLTDGERAESSRFVY